MLYKPWIMRINIYTTEYIGTMEITDESVSIVKDATGELYSFLEAARKNGIRGRREILAGEKRTIVDEFIEPNNPHFSAYFIPWLEKNGFEIQNDTEAMDVEIQKLLENIRDEDLKNKVLTELPSMNYLEKTYILSVLQNQE